MINSKIREDSRLGFWKTLILTGAVLLLFSSCCNQRAFSVIDPKYSLKFPEDHAAHPDFRTEWWYYNGHLETEEGERYCFHLAFFVRRTDRDIVYGIPGRLVTNPAHSAHFAISNLQKKKLYFEERFSRDRDHHGGKAAALRETFHVYNKEWSIQEKEGIHYIEAATKHYRLQLSLAPTKPLVLYGDKGMLVKASGEERNHGSYHFGYTSMSGEGILYQKGRSVKVRASAWFDHEFGSYQLSRKQSGWDWFSLQLNNDLELMLYSFKDRDGLPNKHYGIWIDQKGNRHSIESDEIVINETDTWRSPRNSTEYGIEWRVQVEGLNLDLEIKSEIPDAEIKSWGSLTTYWESGVSAKGKIDGAQVEARGFVEQTGRAHPMKHMWGLR